MDSGASREGTVAARVLPLLTRCSALRENSARLRAEARLVREASSALRRVLDAQGTIVGLPPKVTPRFATVAPVVRCAVCHERVSARELARSAGSPTHARCYEQSLRDLEARLVGLLAERGDPACRSCTASALGASVGDVYAVTARLLASRKVQSAAAYCRGCRRPRVVFLAVANVLVR